MTQADGERADPAELLRVGQAVARDKFIDALARAHFQRVDGKENRWRGTLSFQPTGAGSASKQTMVEIVIPDGFPYAQSQPKVHPIGQTQSELVTGRRFDDYHNAGNGWHRDLDGAMCLFTEADHTLLPWASGEQLLEQARAWLAWDANGWGEDEPTLDLDRYLQSSNDRRLILYGDLDCCTGTVHRLKAGRNDVLRVGGLAAPRRRGGRKVWHRDTVLILDAGDLHAPIRTWDDLLDAIREEDAKTLTRAQQAGLTKVLLTYRRAGIRGVVGIAVEPGCDGGLLVTSLRTAPDDLTTRSVRAHPEIAVLKSKRVAVVGIGAIGSVVADLLHRCGIGKLHLIDGDVMLPGNTTRHLLADDAVGLPKAKAVAEALRRARPHFGEITWSAQPLTSIDEALQLLGDHEVVLDATADSTATALLTTAANAGAGQLLSACVLGEGHAVRVDCTPTKPGEEPLPLPQLPQPSDPIYETGCGSPVSAVPPTAVWEAAAIAARNAIRLLLNRDAVAAGEQRIIGRELTI